MNKIYKHVTNAKNGQLVSAVAAETARTTGGSSTVDATSGQGAATATNWLHDAAGRGLKSLTAGILGMMGVLSYAAAPVGVVAHGQASLVTQGSVLHINQTSQAATVNFQQLNLAKGEGVAVQAQKTSDITLLRVASGMNVNGGFVTANNNLLISSPGGILVSNGGKISAQGEVYMTTQDMAVGQYNKPTAKASTGSLSISGQSVISGSNIVLDAGSVNLNQAKVIAAPATAADGIRVQGANVSIQSSHLSAPGGKIEVTADAQGSGINVQNSTLSAEGGKLVIGVDALGAYAAATTVQGSALSGHSVKLAGRVLNLDSTNSVAAAHTQIQTVDLLVNADMGKLLSSVLQAGSDVVLQGDNSVSMDRDATIAANTSHNTSLSIANTGSQQNNPNAPSSPTTPKPNQVAILGTINLNGGRKSLLVHSAGDLTLDGTRSDVSGDTTFQAIGTIVVNAAQLSTVGDLTIGRDAFGQGALSRQTVVFDSTLNGYNIETSGDTLTTQGVTARTTGGVWLLDPTNITISSAASTGGSLAAAQGQAGATTISTIDIQNAINAGTSVDVVGSGTITLSNNLSFANSTANATLTLDNTSGSKQGITLTGGIAATGTSLTSVVVKSAGGTIKVGGAINVTGSINLDNSFGGTAGPGGTATSGFLLKLSNQTTANTNASGGVLVNQTLTASGSITLKGATLGNGVPAGIGVSIEKLITAGNGISISGAGGLLSDSIGLGIYVNAGLTATGGDIVIKGQSYNYGIIMRTAQTITAANGSVYIAGSSIVPASSIYTNHGIEFDAGYRIIANNNIDLVGFVGANATTAYGAMNAIGKNGVYNNLLVAKTGYITLSGGTYQGSVTTTKTAGGIAISGLAAKSAGAFTIQGAVLDSDLWAVPASGTSANTIGNMNAVNIGNYAVTVTGTTYNGTYDGIQAGAGINIAGAGLNAATIVNLNATKLTNATGDINVSAYNTAGGSNIGITTTGAITQNSNGGDVIFTSNNSISQTGIITLAANNSGFTSDVRYDTRPGNKFSQITTGTLNLTGGVAGSANPINYSILTAGAPILSAGAIVVNGAVTIDNSYATNGVVSGFINETNGAIYAGPGVTPATPTAPPAAVYIAGNVTGSTISIVGAGGTPNQDGLTFDGALSATGDINITGTNNFSGALAVANNTYGIYTNKVFSVLSTNGNVNITGATGGSSASIGSIYGGIYFNNVNATANASQVASITGNKITINGYAANTANDTSGKSMGVGSYGVDYTINPGVATASGQIALSITGTTVNQSNQGINLFTTSGGATGGLGTITSNLNGGNIAFTSNGQIVAIETIDIAKNTSGFDSQIIYNTTSGSNRGVIANYGVVTVASGSTSAVNFQQISNGARIVNNGAINVSGYVNIDNTNGSSTTATLANSNGATITGSITSGSLAGANGVTINTIASGTGIGISDTAPITAATGTVRLTAKSETASSIDLTSSSTITSAGGISVIGSGLASTDGTAGAVSTLGAISNTGANGVLISSTGNTATANVSDSGTGGISITGGYGIAAGTLTNGTITAVGALSNTNGGVISLSMAQPTATPGTVGSIEAAAGVTSGNATTASNVSYGNVGGVMGAVNAATVNTVNYRNTPTGTSITLQVENYSQVYGTSYTDANGWLSSSSNVTVSSVTGSTSGFGVVGGTPTTADVLSSLRFAGNLGAAGNSNLVQSLTNLSTAGSITSSYGNVVVTNVANKNTYTITPKALTITGRTAAKVYDGVSTYADVSAAGTTYVGLVSSIGGVLTGDAVTSLTRVITTAADTATPISGLAVVGSYVNTLSNAVGSGLSNYTITYVPGSFAVTPATLTVTGSNRTTTYNATLQNNNATYSVGGLLGADTVTSVGGVVASGTNAGSYNDSLSGALGAGLSNYSINYVNGALTINRAALNIASAATSSVYTAGAQTGTYTVTGLQGTVDAVTGVTGLASGTNAGTYTSTLGGATGTGLDNYNITYTNTAPFTITKANATLVGVLNNTAVYSGSAQTNTGAVFTGLLGDDATTISATGYAQATNVAQGTVTDNLSATGVDSGNYNFTVTNGSLRITPKALSVVGAQTTSVYNANTQTNTYTTTGLVGTDAIAVTGSASARNVSTTNDALGVAFTRGAASNYTTTITDGFLKITPATITLSGITAADKVYDGNKTASLSLGSVTTGGVLSTDSVTVNTGTLTGAFTDKNVGSQTVVISGISLSGPAAANYQLSGGTTATTTAAITPKTLNVTGTSLTTTYNGGVQSLAAPVVTGLVTGDNVTIGGNASGTNAGAYNATYTAGGTDAGNYNLVSTAPATLTVNKAALVVTANNSGKIVTQADPTLTAQLSGLQGSDTASGLNYTYTISRASGENAGSYAITPTGAASLTNYTVSYVPGQFTITPAGTVLIKMNPTTSTYGTVVGGTIASVEYVASSGGSLRTLTLKAGTTNVYTDGITGGGEITITPTTSVTSTTNAGTYVGAISNSNSDVSQSNGNFTGVQTIVNTAVVNQANLTLALAPVTKTYDGTAFAATGVAVTPTGLMNGQTLDNLGGLTYSGAAIGAINASASPYSLVGSVGSGFSNYNVTIAPSTVTINKAPLQITGGTNTFTFDNTTRTNTYAVTGGQLFASDSITGLTGRATRLHAGTTADTLSAATGTGLSNYDISYVNGGLTINPAQLLAVATPTRTPVYNGSTAVPNTTVLSGVIAGTSVSGVTSLALSGAGAGTQTIINNGTLLSGPNAGDYVVLSSNLAHTGTNQVTPNLVSSGNGGGTVVITPAPLTITGGNASYVFNNTQRTNTYSVTSGTLYGSDSVTGVTGSGSGLRANTSANLVYADNLSAATGTGLSNYAITYVNGRLTITPAPLTALATPLATTYSGGTNVANTTALTGVIAGTTVSGTTSLVMGSRNAGTQTITNNGTTLSGDFATDYYVVSSNLVGTMPTNRVTPSWLATGNGGGTIVVDKAPLTINGAKTEAVYNGTQQTNTATVTGAVNGEQITTSGSAVATNVSQGKVNDALVAVASSGVDLNNYQIAISQGSLEITPATLTVSGITANAKQYDGTDAATLSVSTVSYNGVFPVDANDTNKLAVSTASLQGLFEDANAGVNKDVLVSGISITGSASSNYQLSGGNSLVVAGTITPAPLTITGGNARHVFNNTTRTNTFSVSGTLYGSDSVTGVTGSGTGLHAGTHADNLSAADGFGISNYDVTYVNGALTITRAQLTALATPLATTYSGGTNVANTTALTGVIAGTDVSGITSLVLGSPNAGLRNIINNGTTLSGPNGGDYEVVSSNLVDSSNLVGTTPNQVTPTLVSSGNGGGTIMVAKAPLTIAGATTQMMYNGTQQTNTATVTGAVNGEAITTSGNAVARNVGDVVADSLQAVAGSGVDLNNYAITFTPGSLEITPAPLIEKPADVFILPPTPPVFVAPLDRISDVLANLSGIRLSPANDPAGQPGACSADSAVLFGADSDVLTDEAKEKLRQCCAKNQPITLSGLRGAEGSGQFNIDLGKRRAQVVRKFMENACQMPQAGHPGKPQ